MELNLAVIGAGPTGLCLLRNLKSLRNVHVVCYEKGSCLGGTWVYTDTVGKDDNGLPIHSSMYRDLRSNFPKELMAFPDFPFQEDLPSFVTHEETLQYLHQYARHFDILDSIQLNPRVEDVQPIPNTRWKWKISVCDVTSPNHVQHMIYDYVVVCSGHFSTPNIPTIPGQDEFKGRILHSHDYRENGAFRGETVALLGAMFSGTDIAVDLCSSASKTTVMEDLANKVRGIAPNKIKGIYKKCNIGGDIEIYLCHNKTKLEATLPHNVEQRPGIKKLTKGTVVFTDETELAIDTLMYCTGYIYNFPFLSEACQLPVTNGRMPTLYKHVFHTHFPSLCIMGACKDVSPFLCYHLQAQLIARVVDGSVTLPPTLCMELEIQANFERRQKLGMPVRKAHWMADLQWEYYDDLSRASGVGEVPRWVKRMFKVHIDNKLANIMTYKDYTFKVIGPDAFVYWYKDKTHEMMFSV